MIGNIVVMSGVDQQLGLLMLLLMGKQRLKSHISPLIVGQSQQGDKVSKR